MKERYALEKLRLLIHDLAVEPGDIRRRLKNSYVHISALSIEDLPDHLKSDWAWIKHELTKHGPITDHNGEVIMGSVNHTMGRIRNSTGTKIAKKIYQLFDRLNSEFTS